MPIEFASDLLENDDFRIETNSDGDLVQIHKQTGAEFKFDVAKDAWVPVQGLDLGGENIENVGSVGANSVDAESVSTDDLDTTNSVAEFELGSEITLPSGTFVTIDEWSGFRDEIGSLSNNEEWSPDREGRYLIRLDVGANDISDSAEVSVSISDHEVGGSRDYGHWVDNGDWTASTLSFSVDMTPDDSIVFEIRHRGVGSDVNLGIVTSMSIMKVG